MTSRSGFNAFYDFVFYCSLQHKIEIERDQLPHFMLALDTLRQRYSQNLRSVDKYFDEIIVTDELGRDYWKPHPKAFEVMKEKFQVNFDEMIYVGDNPEKDFYISKTYPIKTVRILRDGVHSDKKCLEGIEADISINHLQEIDSLLNLNTPNDLKEL